LQLIGLWVRKELSEASIRERLKAIFDQVPDESRDRRWRDRVADIDRCVDDICWKDAAAHWDAEADAPRFSEEALALRFAARHEPAFRFMVHGGVGWSGTA
jgi:hypothetical protein